MVGRSVTADSETRTVEAELLEAVQQAVIVTDLDWTITYWNRFAETLYGWSTSEALGRNLGELIVPETSEAHSLDIMASLVQGQSWSSEVVFRRRDGTSFPCLVTLADLKRCAEEQHPVRREIVHHSPATGRVRELVLNYACVPPQPVMIHVEDVTEARKAQAHADQERATLDAVMSSMTDGLVVMGGVNDGNILFANARAADLLGVPPETLGTTSGVMTMVTQSRLENPAAAAADWGDALTRLDQRPSFEATVRGSPPRNLLVQLFEVPSHPGTDGRVDILFRDVTAERDLMRNERRTRVGGQP